MKNIMKIMITALALTACAVRADEIGRIRANFKTQIENILGEGKELGAYSKMGICAKNAADSGSAQKMYTVLYYLDQQHGYKKHQHAYMFRMFVAQNFGPYVTDFDPSRQALQDIYMPKIDKNLLREIEENSHDLGPVKRFGGSKNIWIDGTPAKLEPIVVSNPIDLTTQTAAAVA